MYGLIREIGSSLCRMKKQVRVCEGSGLYTIIIITKQIYTVIPGNVLEMGLVSN